VQADRRISVGDEFVTATYCGSDAFLPGIDDGLIRLSRYLDRIASGDGPRAGDIDADAVFDSGQLGRTHVLDVTTEDPETYRFVTYGVSVGLDQGRSYEGLRLRDGRTRVIRDLACWDYQRAKSQRRRSLTYVAGHFSGQDRRYRRLIQPLIGSGRRVTHLLVSTTEDLNRMVPCAPVAYGWRDDGGRVRR